jgi:hypothetical protein
MPLLRRIIIGALLGALLSTPAFSQSVQFGAGQVFGNASAAQRNGRAETVTSILDRALGSTRGAVLERGAAGWVITAPGTAGLAWVSGGGGADPTYGIVGLNGGGCNAALTASIGGILYSTAGACAILSGTATAGQMLRSGASAAPSWSTSTYPATAAAGTVMAALTANTVTASAAPVLGIAGSVVGSIGFQNATSGTATLQPVTGALGTATILIPGVSGTMAVSGTAPISVNASTGAISITSPLPLTNGGSNASLTADLGAMVYSTAAGFGLLAHNAAASFPVLSGASAAPTWATISYPTSANSGGVAYFSSSTVMASSAALTANQIMVGGGAGTAPTTFACATTTTLVHGGTPPTCSGVAYADILTAAIATNAQYLAGTASELVQSGTIYQAETTTTYGATTTFDFSTFINTNVTLTANITTQTLSNVTAGKAGTISFTQSGAGSFTTVWNSIFKFASGATPSLTTGSATAVDVLSYSCRSATVCVASLLKDVR